MSPCPRCKTADVARWEAIEDGVWNSLCNRCDHTWTTVEVPEEYLHNLISRSLELAAIKSKLNRKE